MISSAPLFFPTRPAPFKCATNSVRYPQDPYPFLGCIFLSGKDSKAMLCAYQGRAIGDKANRSRCGKVSGEGIFGQPIDQFKIFMLSCAPIEGFNESTCILNLQFSRPKIFDHFQHAAGQITVIATTEKSND